MSRIERLVNLTAALLAAERPLTAEELRSRVPGYPDDKLSFRRQFERDKEALRDLGLPLTTTPIAGDSTDPQVGYRVKADEYYLRDPGLAPDELSALHLAARVVRIDGMATSDAAWKLGEAIVGTSASDDAIAATLPANDALPALFAAIAAGEAVRFGYRDRDRLIQPTQLAFRNGHWYVAGYDAGRGDERSFRVDRIEGTVVAERASAPVPDVDGVPASATRRRSASFGRPWELGDGDQIEARVRIDAAQAVWAIGHLGRDAVVTEHAEGDVTVSLMVRNVDAFRSFVLGFLDHAVVESPAELCDDIVTWLQAMASGAV